MKKIICLLFLLCFATVSFAESAPVFYGSIVVVTASKWLQPKSQAFAGVKVITADDIEKMNAKNVAQAIEYVTGVYIKANGGLGGINTFKLKSANSQQVLILVDGARINSTLLGMYDIADIPTDNVEKIEIVDEGISSVYGTDAIGGVINIITRSKKDRAVSAQVRGGSFGELSGGFSLSNKLFNGDSFVSYSNLKSDGFRVNSDYRSGVLTVNYSVGDALSVRFNSVSSDKGNPGVPSSDTDPASASTPFDRQKDNTNNLSIVVNGKISDNNTSRFVLSRVSSDQKVHYQDSFVPGLFYDDSYYSSIYGTELQNTSKLSKYVNLTTGAEWKRNLGESSKAGSHMLDDTSLYVNAEIGAGMPMGAYLGGRLDINSVWGNSANPRIGMVVNFNDSTRLRASIATAFRAPTINELYWNEPSWGMFGNPNLKPENSKNFNITLEKDNGSSRVSFNYYKNVISDMIRWSQTAPWVWQPVNIDSAKIEGVGIEASGSIIGPVSAFANCNLENSIDNSTNRVLNYSPLQKVNAGLQYSAGDITGVLQLKARSNVFYDSYGTGVQTTNVLNGHNVVDLNINKKFKNFKVSLQISNLFNENYYESIGTSAVDYKERGYPMPGRAIEVGVTM